MSFLFRCCCRPFLAGGDDGTRAFYDLLSLDKVCTCACRIRMPLPHPPNPPTPHPRQECSTEDIKRAYKRKSLELHPDKLAQRGQVLTPEDQARFQRVKEAYGKGLLSFPFGWKRLEHLDASSHRRSLLEFTQLTHFNAPNKPNKIQRCWWTPSAGTCTTLTGRRA